MSGRGELPAIGRRDERGRRRAPDQRAHAYRRVARGLNRRDLLQDQPQPFGGPLDLLAHLQREQLSTSGGHGCERHIEYPLIALVSAVRSSTGAVLVGVPRGAQRDPVPVDCDGCGTPDRGAGRRVPSFSVPEPGVCRCEHSPVRCAVESVRCGKKGNLK